MGEHTAIERVARVFNGSDADATRALYADLEAMGPAGRVAAMLMRAQKNSGRAKVYRGRGFRGAAYDRKAWAMDQLTFLLAAEDFEAGISWGWGPDDMTPGFPFVLYVELPTGQVSFHARERGGGPDHAKTWDGARGQSADRICRWAARLLDGKLHDEVPG